MSPRRVQRFSPALVVIGYLLWIPTLFILLGVTGCTVLTMGASGVGSVSGMDTAKQAVVKQLIDDKVDAAAVDEFRRTSDVSAPTLARLPPEQRTAVEAAITAHRIMIGGGTVATAAVTGFGLLFLVVAWAGGVPFFIVGLILTLKRNVWQCSACQYIYDRA
jgi:hypothetical protein